jgi:hypothetical protein
MGEAAKKRRVEAGGSGKYVRCVAHDDDGDVAATCIAPRGIDGYHCVIGEVRRLYAIGETAAALELAATIHRSNEGSPRTSEADFELPTVLSVEAIPFVALDAPALQQLPLDHRAGFLLSNIDGVSTFGAIIEVMDAAGMDEGETRVVLDSLIGLGAVALD